MLRIRKTYLALIAISAIFIIGSGCSDDANDDKQTAADYVELGKLELGQALYGNARQSFEKALKEYDPNNKEAQFGWTISRGLETITGLVTQLLELIEYIAPLLKVDPALTIADLDGAAANSAKILARAYPEIAVRERSTVGMLIEAVVGQLRADLAQADIYLDSIAESDADFRFFIQSLPFKLGPIVVGNFGGEYDKGEIYGCLALVRFLAGLIDTVMSIDFSFDIQVVLDMMTDYPEIFPCDTMEEMMAMMVFVLRENPDLLGLEPENGADYLEAGGINLGGTFGALSKGMQYIVDETDYQGDDILKKYEVDNRGDMVTHILIKLDTTVDPFKEDKIEGLLDIPLWNSQVNLIDLTDLFYENILGRTSQRISFSDDLIPLSLLIFEVVMSTGLFQSLAESLVGELDLNQALGLLPTLFADELLQLDIGAFYSTPISLRQLLPAFTTTRGGIDDMLILEWECDADTELDAMLFCEAGSSIDSGHFNPVTAAVSGFGAFTSAELGSISSITADGINNRVPYIAFGNPSFNGLLYIDTAIFANDKLPETDGAVLADQKNLNALIAYFVTIFVSLMP